jgi:hypothetical protein
MVPSESGRGLTFASPGLPHERVVNHFELPLFGKATRCMLLREVSHWAGRCGINNMQLFDSLPPNAYIVPRDFAIPESMQPRDMERGIQTLVVLAP